LEANGEELDSGEDAFSIENDEADDESSTESDFGEQVNDTDNSVEATSASERSPRGCNDFSSHCKRLVLESVGDEALCCVSFLALHYVPHRGSFFR